MIRGVNLGGWLVLEKWITPALLAGTSAEDKAHLWSADIAGSDRRHRYDHRPSETALMSLAVST